MFSTNPALGVTIVVVFFLLILWIIYLEAALARSRNQTKMAIDVSDRGRRFNQALIKTTAIMTRNSKKLVDRLRNHGVELPLLEHVPSAFDVADLDAEYLENGR